jgi:Zn-finger protein
MALALRLSLKRHQMNAPGYHNTFCTYFHCHKGKAHCVKCVSQYSFDNTKTATKNNDRTVAGFRKLRQELENIHIYFSLVMLSP